jgi:tetratricopeptide (TPR) repeat protein
VKRYSLFLTPFFMNSTIFRHRFIPLLAAMSLGSSFAFWNARKLQPELEQPASASATMDSPLHKSLKAAQTAISSSDGLLAKRIETILSLPETEGKTADIWVSLGNDLSQWQRNTNDARAFNWAESVYLEALQTQPKDTAALLGLAWATGGRHEFSKSMEWAQKALDLDPQCAGAHGVLGDAQLELGNLDAAMDSYQAMIDSKPDLSSWSRGAYALWMKGDTSKAQWLMHKAIQAGGPNAENTDWCRAKLAEMLWHDGNYKAASQALSPALQAKRPIISARMIGARIAESLGSFDEARQHYLAVLEQQRDAKAIVGLMEIQMAQGMAAEAESSFQNLKTVHGDESNAHGHDHIFMAKIYADLDRELPLALRMAEESKLTQNPREADVLAWVYFKNKRLPEAIAAIKRALRHGTPDAEIHFHAGLIAREFGDLTSARKHLQKAIQMNPNFHIRHAKTALEALQGMENHSASLTKGTEINPLTNPTK